ncbi:MAG: preprotein translocase subunit SecY, partial [Spirochaetes bacterium]|nr:preprotein translocase subunit SecY [Spirochaetota bacterium]
MAGSPLVDVFRIKELRQRILYTIGWLVVFRIGTYIPIPGINASALKLYFASATSGGGITDYLDFFSGGAFKNFSLFMLSVMPYISTQIIMQLLLVVFPSLKRIAEDDGGRKKIALYTRLGTVVVCIVQSLASVSYVRSIPDSLVIGENLYTVLAIFTVTTGSLFLVWIGEQITKRGIGNGISMIIFAGIVARLPNGLYSLWVQIRLGEINPVFAVIVIAMFVAVVALVVIEQQGQRKIPVQYAKRVVGRRMYGGQNTYIPFKINPSGVIPVIFASSLLTFPLQLAQGFGSGAKWVRDLSFILRPDGWLHLTL